MKLSTFALKFLAFFLTFFSALPLFFFLILPALGRGWIAILLALGGGVCVVLFVSNSFLRDAANAVADPKALIEKK